MKPALIFSASIAALLLAGTVQAADPELVIFEWAGYEDPVFFPAYAEKHKLPTFSFFGDEEEAFQKMRAGFKADLAHPCAQSVVKWNEAGLLKPIDTSRIPAWDDLMDEFKEMDGFTVDGQVYVVPVEWGASALTYRTDEVPAEDAETLQSFVDPKYEGRISIPDNVDDAYALAYLAHGITDWKDATDEDFQAASDWLRQLNRNVRTYWQDSSDLAQLMASGEVVLAWAWSDTAATTRAEGHPVEMNRGTKEGSSTWVCGFVHLAEGQGSEEKVYDFINAWLEPRTAEYLVGDWGYAHSNAAAMAAIDDEVLESTGYSDFEKYTDNTLWQSPIRSEMREKMIAEFEKIKAGF